jgi:hypothetical protein
MGLQGRRGCKGGGVERGIDPGRQARARGQAASDAGAETHLLEQLCHALASLAIQVLHHLIQHDQIAAG